MSISSVQKTISRRKGELYGPRAVNSRTEKRLSETQQGFATKIEQFTADARSLGQNDGDLALGNHIRKPHIPNTVHVNQAGQYLPGFRESILGWFSNPRVEVRWKWRTAFFEYSPSWEQPCRGPAMDTPESSGLVPRRLTRGDRNCFRMTGNLKLADSSPRSQVRVDHLGLAMGASRPTTWASFSISKA